MVNKILSIGNVSVDVKAFSYEDDGTEAYRDGTIELVPGGVGRGMALNLKNLGLETAMYSVLGKDIFGDFLHNELSLKGVDTALLRRSDSKKTALFSIMASVGKPASCVYCTDILNEITLDDEVKTFIKTQGINTLAIDSNISEDAFKDFYNLKQEKDLFVFQNATAPDISKKVLPYAHLVDLYGCNEFEAAMLLGEEAIPDVATAEKFKKLGFSNFIITFGEQGVMVHINGETWNEKPYAPPMIADTIGAGDAFASGFLMGYLTKKPIKRCIQYGLACAKETLQTRETVNDILCAHLVETYPDH